MKKEFYNVEEIILAVLRGADNVAIWFGGNHSIGHYEIDEDDNQEIWISDDFTDLEALELIHAILLATDKRFHLRLSKRQEKNFWNIINWLREDEVEIRLPA